jgi:hypothetical protein
MHMTRTARLCLVAALSLASSLAMSDTPAPNISSTHETNASRVSLPPSDPGVLSVLRSCSDCGVLSFTTTPKTSYELGEQVVSVTALRQEFSLHPDAFVLVVLDTDLKHVKQVRMNAPATTVPNARAR